MTFSEKFCVCIHVLCICSDLKVYTNEIIPNTLFCIWFHLKIYHGVFSIPLYTDLSHHFGGCMEPTA